jgi:two-component system response regulator YesN
MEKHGLPKSSFSIHNLNSYISTLFDIVSIESYFTDTLLLVSEAFKQKETYSSEDVIENIKTYLSKNFSKDINLERVASIFFLNSSYLSFLFKEKTNLNFSDYLTNIRIEKAKELLKNTNLKLSSISKSVVYDNSKYFFRVFKKVTGSTPLEYKKMSHKRT